MPKSKPAKKPAAKSSPVRGSARAGAKGGKTEKSKAPAKASGGASAKKPLPAKGGGGTGAGGKVAKSVAPSAPAGGAAGAGQAGAGGDAGKHKPKGITIVSQKPMRKPKVKKPLVMPNLGAPLLKPGQKWKPLIASGPKAPSQAALGHGHSASHVIKTHLGKRDLEHYRGVLLGKRDQLIGDVSNLEGAALKDASGGALSHLPQHMAEQGSDTFDQGLSLDIAGVDRRLIREIDDALARIEANTYGVCEITHKPISKDRLDELPWTRYSIEGARERERRQFMPTMK